MPIYEFHCEKCDRDSEILVRSADWKGTKCPLCGSAKITKRFSTFASANTGGSAAPYSSFVIRADSFSIGSPSGPGIACCLLRGERRFATTLGTGDGAATPLD